MPNESNKISDIAEFLIKNENICLVIQGAWGVGKTCLWREVEKEIKEKNKEKQVVYIDLFGKESYKQILEEIVLKVNGIHNEVLEKAAKFTSGAIKLIVPAVPENINLDSIFSIFKKEDFENIIVCFDNIERKSDKLPLDEILGLVNLLKEDKSCNVVMIFNKDELDKQESSGGEIENSKNWYETYKEKVIDYEIVINNNDGVALKIIEKNLEWDIKDMRQEVVKLVFECFKEEFNNNLRLLIKFTRHIDYFNKHCFFEYYKKDKYKEFLGVLEMYYRAMAIEMKQYYSLSVKDEKLEFYYCYYEIFLNSLLELNEQEKESLKSDFLNLLNDKFRLAKEQAKEALKKKRREFKFSNLEDDKYTQEIRKAFEAIERYILESQYAVEDYEDYITLIEEYNRLTGKTIKPNKEVIDINEKHEKTLAEQNCKEHKNDFKSFIERKLYATEKIFSLQNISEYKFSVNEIVQEFRTNKIFYDKFYEYFSKIESENDVNKYHLQNCLFQAYKTFIDRKETKNKKQTIKETLEETRIGNILHKEYTENQNQDSPYKKFFEYFEKEYAPRNNMHPHTPNIPILVYHLLQAYKEFCGKDENKEEKEKMEENLKKNPLTSVILKLINAEE